jgi:predicted Zn-dependent protease
MVRAGSRAFVVCGCAFLIASCGDRSDDSQQSKSDVPLYANCGNTPNYAAELGSFRMLRWKQFPLTATIDLTSAPSVGVGENRQVYTRAIQEGASKWAIGNGIGAVAFVNSADADIVIRFVDTLSIGTLGEVTWNGPRPYILKGTTINLSIRAFSIFLSEGTPSLESRLRQVMTHEMGHALFSGAHSGDRNDVMGGGLSETLSQRDINTIRESYCSSGVRPATPGTTL